MGDVRAAVNLVTLKESILPLSVETQSKLQVAVMSITKNMKSELNVWYLDDGTLAGNVNTVMEDYCEILKALKSHGLEVNPSKCELFLICPQSRECFQALVIQISYKRC